MCFDLDSHPPIAPVAGGAIDSESLVLRAGDGARLSAFEAHAEGPAEAGVVILPDVRGLHPFYEELALRFADHGVDAIAIDYFGRTAGTIARPRDADFDFSHHVAETRYGSLSWDIQAAVERLRSERGASRVFTIGFCFGGRLAFMTATMGLDLAGVMGFYGIPVGTGRGDVPAPADSTGLMRSPVLALFGGADPACPPESIETFESALGAAGVDHRIVVYPGAPHSFFDRKQEDYGEASADAWEQVLGFIRSPKGAN